MRSRTSDADTGVQAVSECEDLQRAGGFKFRGAANAVAALEPAVRARGVVACSSGNHAQALAYAARRSGVLVSGGNVDLGRFAALMGEATEAAGHGAP